MLMFFTFTFILIIPIFLLLLNFLLKKKDLLLKEKLSSYECGFSPFFNSMYSFSLNFFLICILFLIFDLEIILILPSIYSLFLMNFLWWMNSMIFFFLTLIICLFIEFNEGALSWKI